MTPLDTVIDWLLAVTHRASVFAAAILCKIPGNCRPHSAWRTGGTGMLALMMIVGTTQAQELAPAPAEQAAAPAKPMSAAQAYLEKKLDTIIVPLIQFEDVTLDEACDFFRLRARELDPEPDAAKKGLNLIVRKSQGGSSQTATYRPLGFKLANVTLRKALMECAAQAGAMLTVDDFAVTFTPAAKPESPPTRKDPVDPADAYFEAFLLVRAADKAAGRDEAIQCLQEAETCFQAIKRRFPDWKSAMVDGRIQKTQESIAKLSATGH